MFFLQYFCCSIYFISALCRSARNLCKKYVGMACRLILGSRDFCIHALEILEYDELLMSHYDRS